MSILKGKRLSFLIGMKIVMYSRIEFQISLYFQSTKW